MYLELDPFCPANQNCGNGRDPHQWVAGKFFSILEIFFTKTSDIPQGGINMFANSARSGSLIPLFQGDNNIAMFRQNYFKAFFSHCREGAHPP